MKIHKIKVDTDYGEFELIPVESRIYKVYFEKEFYGEIVDKKPGLWTLLSKDKKSVPEMYT